MMHDESLKWSLEILRPLNTYTRIIITTHGELRSNKILLTDEFMPNLIGIVFTQACHIQQLMDSSRASCEYGNES